MGRKLFLGLGIFMVILGSAYAAHNAQIILYYQGTLTDASGTPLGGLGKTFYFKFSIWDSPAVESGQRLWPERREPKPTPLLVKDGVFEVYIGDTAGGYPDALDYHFSDRQNTYLQIEASPDNIVFQTLSPRQPIDIKATREVAATSFLDEKINLLSERIRSVEQDRRQSDTELFRVMAQMSQATNFGPRGSVPLIISNPTISGQVTGLKDEDIPDDLTISTSKALHAGVATFGDLAVTSTLSGFGTSSPYATLSVEVPSGTKLPAFVVSDQGTSSPLFAVMPSGFVGVGTTTSANEFLLLALESQRPQLQLASRAEENQYINFADFGSRLRWQLGSDDSFGNNGFFIFDNSDSVYRFIINTATNPSSLILQPTNGNVGLGTSSPGTKLGVAGDGLFKGRLTVEDHIKTGYIIATSTTASTFGGNITLGEGQNQTISVATRLTNAAGRSLTVGAGAGFVSVFDINTVDGGGLILTGGDASSQGGDLTLGNGGDVNIVGGALANLGADGDVLLAITSGSAPLGLVGVRRSSPSVALDVIGSGSLSGDLFILGSDLNIGNGISATSTLSGGYGKLGLATTSPWGQFAIEASSVVGSNTPMFVVSDEGAPTPFLFVSGVNGNVGIATASPSAQLAVGGDSFFGGNLTVAGAINVQGFQLSAEGELRFATATVDTSVGEHPILLLLATTTGNLNYARVAVGTSTQDSPAGLLDQLYVAGRINSSWNMYWQDFLGRNNAIAVTADAGVHGLVFDEDAGNSGSWDVIEASGKGGVARLDNPLSPAAGEGEWFGTGGISVINASLNPVLETALRSTANTDHRTVAGFLAIALDANAGADPANGIYFRKAFADTTWQAVTRALGVETVTNTEVGTSDFETLRIEVIDGEEVRFIVNGYVKAVHTSNIPSANMGFYIGNELNSTTNRATDIDYLRVWADDPPTTPLSETVAQVTEQYDMEMEAPNPSVDESIPEMIANAAEQFFEKITAAFLTILPGGEIKVPAGINEISGSSVIPAGSAEVFVANTKIQNSSKIFITPTVIAQYSLAVIDKTAGQGFKVAIPSATVNDIPFDWFIVNSSAQNSPAAAPISVSPENAAIPPSEPPVNNTEPTPAAAEPMPPITASTTEPVIASPENLAP